MKSNSKTKIIFMGGNLIGCSVFNYLFKLKNLKILSVVGNYFDNGSVIEPNVWNASLVRLTLNKNFLLVQPKSVRNTQFIYDIKKLERPDYIITAGYDNILHSEILNIPKIGTLNLHFSPLPKHRGFFPVVWSILEDLKAGVTLHWVNNDVNGGDIIDCETIPITATDTAFDLYLNLSKLGLKLIKKNFQKIIKGIAPRVKQNDNDASYHAAGYPFQRIINWNNNNEKIDRFLRALTFPGFEPARTFYNDLEIDILPPVEYQFDANGQSHLESGTLLEILNKGILVKTADGKLLIKTIRTNKSTPIDAIKLCKQIKLKAGGMFRNVKNIKSDGALSLIVS